MPIESKIPDLVSQLAAIDPQSPSFTDEDLRSSICRQLGHHLSTERERRGISRETIAAALAVSAVYVRKLEYADEPWTPHLVLLYLRALGAELPKL